MEYIVAKMPVWSQPEHASYCGPAVYMNTGVYDHQLYDKMIEIPAVQSETADSSSESSLEADT